ncbi:MraY family glycosyltransferase [Lysobacter sp. D1-1-M9]
MVTWLALFFAMSVVGTWLARRYALQRRLLDQPGERRSHTVATPRGGGIAIAASVLVAAVALAARFPGQRLLLGAFAVGLALVATIGWLDDHRPLSPWWRLLAHVAAAGIFAAALVVSGAGIGTGVFALAAIVILTNVWNFMDGIDGLATSQAAIVASSLAFVADGIWAAVGWALVAACAGFLPFNFPRARIFLGDVGSGALGFVVAALLSVAWFTVQATTQAPVSAASLLLLLPLAPFLIDAGLTLLRRVARGERWWMPHTQHAYQVWARRKGHCIVTVAYGITSAAAIPLAIWAWGGSMVHVSIALAAWYTAGALLWRWLQHGSTDGTEQVQRAKE